MLLCLGVLAIFPLMESQAAPQWSSHDGDCPRLQSPQEGQITLTPTHASQGPPRAPHRISGYPWGPTPAARSADRGDSIPRERSGERVDALARTAEPRPDKPSPDHPATTESPGDAVSGHRNSMIQKRPVPDQHRSATLWHRSGREIRCRLVRRDPRECRCRFAA